MRSNNAWKAEEELKNMLYSGTRQSQGKSAAELKSRTVRPHHPLPGSTLQVNVVLFIPALTKVGTRALLGLAI